MHNNISLWHRAKSDIIVSETLLATTFDGDLNLDIVAYHLQQATEKLMKFQLESQGIVPNRTFDLLILAYQFDVAEIEIPEWIISNAELFREYAIAARYGTNLLATRSKMIELLAYIKTYLADICKE